MIPVIAAPIIEGVFDMGKQLIDKLFPDKEKQAAERAEAERALIALHQEGRLKEMSVQLSAIVAEAQSEDPWTSRARPSFLYVMYVMILVSIPMGILFAFKPGIAGSVTQGVSMWLHSIPEEMWWLFGVGYTGYTGARMFEKRAK